jgi:hypothetical protein
MRTAICATNTHDRGMDLVRGHEVNGTVIGRIWWDNTEDNPGFVMRIGPDEWAPDTIEDVLEVLDCAGFDLDSVSIEDVSALAGGVG